MGIETPKFEEQEGKNSKQEIVTETQESKSEQELYDKEEATFLRERLKGETAVSREEERLYFLHSLVGKNPENLQKVLDNLMTEKDELLKEQQNSLYSREKYIDIEVILRNGDMKMDEISRIGHDRAPGGLSEEELKNGLKQAQEASIRTLEFLKSQGEN